MSSPRDYLDNPREADLAERIWALTLQLTPYNYKMNVVHEFFDKLPHTNRRIILARDWATDRRETTNSRGDADGGVEAIAKAFPGTNFTAGEIGNVEHFFVAALFGTIGGPTNVIMIAGTGMGTLFWEVIVGPARAAWNHSNLPAEELIRLIGRALQNGISQFAFVDWLGYRFGSMYSLAPLFKEAANTPPPVPAAPPAPAAPGALPTVTVGPGDSLSLIAQRQYNDMLLWPVIYDANIALIGPNPNKTKVGQVLVIPSIAGMTAAQRQNYHTRGMNWRSYNN